MKLIGATLVTALAATAALAPAAQAAPTRTYCQGKRAANHGTLVKKVNGVTVYRVGRLIYGCSDLKRKNVAVYRYDVGYKIAIVKASNSRCLAIALTGRYKIPEIAFKDLAGSEIGTSVSQPGYGQKAATVDSLAVTSNCAAAWGQSITDQGGVTTYEISAKGFGKATDVVNGRNTVAKVGGPADVAGVRATALGRKVVVRWTQAGAPQSKTLPA